MESQTGLRPASEFALGTGRGRLRYLANILANLPAYQEVRRLAKSFVPAKFNLSVWEEGPTEPNVCGTSACAVGFAMFDPDLTAQGLEAVQYAMADDGKSPLYEPQFEGDTSFVAAEKFFALNNFADAEYLFSPGYYDGGKPAPEEVAARITDYLVEGNPKGRAGDWCDECQDYHYD